MFLQVIIDWANIRFELVLNFLYLYLDS